MKAEARILRNKDERPTAQSGRAPKLYISAVLSVRGVEKTLILVVVALEVAIASSLLTPVPSQLQQRQPNSHDSIVSVGERMSCLVLSEEHR